MKKVLALILAALMLAGVMAGCGEPAASGASGGEAPQNGSAPEEEDVKLTFLKGGTQPMDREYWTDYVTRYQEANPGVTIEYSEATWDDFDTKLNVALAAGTAPDIVGERLGGIAVRGSEKQYVDLNPYIDAMDDKDDFIEATLQQGQYEGAQIAFPIYPGPIMWVYNKEHFKEVGLDPEDPPATWEEILSAAEKLTVKNGDVVERAGFLFTANNDWIACPIMRQAGVDLADAEGNPGWNCPEMITALEFIKELSQYTISITSEEESQSPPFMNGTASMSVLSPSSISQFIAEHPEQKDNIGVFYPENVRASVWSGCEFVAITSDSKNPDAAWAFIKSALEPDEMWTRYEKANFPVVRKSLQDKYLEADPLINGAIFEGMTIGKGAEKATWWLTGLKYILNTSDEVFYGAKTPEEALESNYEQFLQAIQ
ncbi:MAG: extracellular solute-binding protein [Oscillospiraceae bacterium]|nr:extracellular solute-binding protein [Oscillospiraceae bacterium]